MAHTYGGGGRIPSSGTTTTSNPATDSINLPAGTTVLWVSIVCGGTTARAGGAPTFNGAALTQRTTKTNSGGASPEVCIEDWYLLAPATGSSYTLSIPNSGSLALAISYAYGSAQTDYVSFFDVGGVLNGESTNPSATLNSVSDGAIIFGAVGSGAQTWNPSGRSGTQINDWDAGNWGRGAQYFIKSGAGNQTISWTFGTSEDWVITGAAFRERHNKRPVPIASTSGSGTGSSYNISLSGLGVQQNDIIVVSASQVSNSNVSVGCSGNTSGAYQTLGGEVYSDETNYDANFEMFYQVAGSTPDTTITISRPSDATSGGSATVSIWRNADPNQPFETAGTPSTGGNTSRGTPPAVTPAVANSVVISAGTGSQSSAGSAPTVPSNMISLVTVNGDGSSADSNNFQAYADWASGTFTPNAWTGGYDATDCAWAAQTVILRPIPATITASLDVGIGTITSAATGALPIAGSSSVGIGTISSTAAGTLLIAGTAEPTLSDVTSTATGALAIVGTVTVTIGEVALTAEGDLIDGLSGSLTGSIGEIALTASGVVLIQGSVSASIGNIGVTATSTLLIAGSGSPSVGQVTSSASGQLTLQGSVNASIGTVDVAATGVLPIIGELAANLGNIGLVAAGGVVIPVVTPARRRLNLTSARLSGRRLTLPTARLATRRLPLATSRLASRTLTITE